MKINIRQKENNLNNEFEILYNNELKYIAKVPSVSIDEPLKLDDLRKIRVTDNNNNIIYTTNYNYSLKKNEKCLPFNFLITGEQAFNQLLFVTKNRSIKIYYEEDEEGNNRYVLDVGGKKYYCYSFGDGYIRHFPIFYREKQVAEILKSNIADADEYLCYVQKEYKIIRDGIALLAIYLDRSEYNFAYIRDKSDIAFDVRFSSKYYNKNWVKNNFDSTFFDKVDEAVELLREKEKQLKREKRNKAKKERAEKKTKTTEEKKVKAAEEKKEKATKEKKVATKKETKVEGKKTRKPRLKKADLIEEIRETLEEAEQLSKEKEQETTTEVLEQEEVTEEVESIPEKQTEEEIDKHIKKEKKKFVLFKKKDKKLKKDKLEETTENTLEKEQEEVIQEVENVPLEQVEEKTKSEEIETALEEEQKPEVVEEKKKKKKKFSFWKLWIISIFIIIILLLVAYFLNEYRIKLAKEEEARKAEKIITGEVYIKITSIDSAKVAKDEDNNRLQVEGKMKLSFSEEKHYDVTLWGYCLGDEGEKYIIFGPDNEEKSYHDGNHKFKLVNTVNNASGDVIYKDGTTKKFDDIPWSNVRIKSCKIEKLISYEKLKDNITVKSTKKLNFEKEIKSDNKK